MWRTPLGPGERSSQSSHLQAGNASSSLHNINQIASHTDQYAVLVSCRCNYTGIYFVYIFTKCIFQNTFENLISCLIFLFSIHVMILESRLFFKQPTSWRPRISRDILISVASEMSRQTLVSNGRGPQLPVQVFIYR